ncbi:hypothetical protein [Enterocloster clostridioformis]|uniref:hypothetical protein n=1 Tax=Enterocloster clostridioformis TaxID=1531 RepID=UPI00048105A4|nr:hypothetical protein [Enterocloster clostridioformis]
MITNNKNRENHWLYSDKEQDELIKCRLTVPGAEKALSDLLESERAFLLWHGDMRFAFSEKLP